MKIYTHPNLYQVVNIQNILLLNRIKTQLRNEYASGAAGDLAPHDVWPELWLFDERDKLLAMKVIDQLTTRARQADWFCSQCGEQNGGAFEACWQCEHPAPEGQD